MKLWAGIERWLPASIALAAVLGVMLVGWTQGERISLLAGEVSAIHGKVEEPNLKERMARLEGALGAIESELNRRTELEATLRLEVQTLQAHVVVLNREMVKAGLNPPPPPEPTGK